MHIKKHTISIVIGIPILIGLYIITLYHYLLFHTLAELFSIAIAWGIFIIVWNTRSFIVNNYLLILGVSYMFVGLADLLHTIAYKGMGGFHDKGNMGIQFWIIARYVESISLMIAPFFLKRKLNIRILFLIYTIIVISLLLSVFSGIFPDCFSQERGLTPFNRINEYLICLILDFSLIFLFKKYNEFDRLVFMWLVASVIMTTISEIVFTYYTHSYGAFSIFGLYLKIVSFYCIYKAIIETGLRQPYTLLFRELKQSEKVYRTMFEGNLAVQLLINPENGDIIDANPAASKFYGYPLNKLRSMKISDINTLSPEQIKEEMTKANKRDSGCFHFRHRLANGDIRDVEVYSSPIKLKGKNILYSIVHDITERIEKEQEVISIWERLEFLLAYNPTVIYSFDLKDNYRVTFISKNVADILGYDPCQFTDDPRFWFNKVHPDDMKWITKALTLLFEKEYHSLEYRFLNKNGEYVWMHDKFRLVRDKEGNPIEVIGTLLNIHERKKTDQALSESEKQLRSATARLEHLLRFSPAMIYTCRPYGDYGATFISENIIEQLGYTPEEIINTHEFWMNHVHPDDVQSIFSELPPLFEKGEHTHEYRFRHKNGKYIWIHDRLRLIKDAEGNPVEIVGSWMDITDRKEAEERLRESEARSKAMLAAIPDLMFRIKTDGTFIDFNASSEAELLIPADKIIGNNIREMGFPSGFVEKYFELVEKAARQNAIQLHEYQLEFPDSIRDYESRIMPSGKDEVIAIVRNVSELKSKERELKEAKEKADIANRAKSEFLANMSHELRTPLNGILGYTQLFQEDNSLTEQQRIGIETIHRCGEYLLLLINDILDISKIEAQKMALEPKEFHFPSFLQTIADIIHIRATQNSILFTHHIDAKLPEGVYGDEKRLRQILLNLLGNAVKFTSKTGNVIFKVSRQKGIDIPEKSDCSTANNQYPSSLTQQLTANTQHPTPNTQHLISRIRFEVKDNGIGIPLENLEEIFLPFQQVGDKRIGQEGTGLGLSISQQLVRIMGSELYVKSSPDKGSSFWFEIDLPEIRWKDVKIEKSKKIIAYKGKRYIILIVDDVINNRMIIKRLLAPLGFEVIEAINGCDAVKKTIEFHPDLIFMDIVMPEMNGLEATIRIRNQPELKDIVVIAMTANISEETRQKSLAAGCNEYMTKPINLKKMTELIKKFLKLEWIYQENDDNQEIAEAFSEKSGVPIVPPSKEALEKLFIMAMKGDIRGLEKEGKKLKSSEFIGFGEKLYSLAKDFQIDKIQKIIEQYIKSPK